MADSPPASVSPYRWLIIVLAMTIGLLAVYRFSSPATIVSPLPQLPRLSTIPPFVLTERSGKTVTNRDLAGKIWIASFIYTTCPGPCPVITTNMAKLQDDLAHDPDVMLVSFTVDPVTDTPDVLAKYADNYKADPDRWWFLTGPEKPLDDLIMTGFLQSVQDNTGQPPQEGQFKVTHSTYLALIDANGTMRGVYSGIDAAGHDKLLHDIKELEKEMP